MDAQQRKPRPLPNGGNGRPRGALNRTTRDVREAIAELARNNIHKLQAWLELVAKKDPARAAELFLRALEYHVPKLSRCEAITKPQDERPVRQWSTAEIRAKLQEYEDEEARSAAEGRKAH